MPALSSPPEAVLSVPARHNPRLQAVVERINADDELRQWWRCANVNAVDRLGMHDYGGVHIRIVANAGLRLLRLLRDAGQVAGVVAQYHLTWDDAEVVVVVAAALHDLGLTVRPQQPEAAGLALAALKARELLADVYPLRPRAIILTETLHAMATLRNPAEAMTLEAGVLALADALDMADGRTRLPAEADAKPLPVIDEVLIRKGTHTPVRVEIRTRTADALTHAHNLLHDHLQHSPLAGLVEIAAPRDSHAERP
jgi:metal-dependent HD superfamily phosphatase/phosphodiesterase